MTAIDSAVSRMKNAVGTSKKSTSSSSSRSTGPVAAVKSVLRPSFWLPATVLLVIFATLWRWTADSKPYLLPPLSAIGESIVNDWQYYVSNAWVTLQVSLIGLAIAFVASFLLAILISEIPMARRAIMPYAVVLNVTPLVALAPALVVAFGFGSEPKLIVTALICFFPILISVSTGLLSVDPAALHVFRTLKASRFETLWHLRIPSSLPYMFTALRVVFPLSIIGAVVAELNAPGAAEGLGTAISLASSNNQLSVIYASIVFLALMGAGLLFIVTAVERRVLHWHESRQVQS
ncbi:ABC transporter permease [Demequina sediminicola]|uniref:ABC transporter permease n=1 Tax=Demequina sediminicola TaxID=1095026 RepID=UPI000B158A3D|nr:ABC transporter permease [Demequina sediminicola]